LGDGFAYWGGDAEFAGPENDAAKKIKDWKMHDLDINIPRYITGA